MAIAKYGKNFRPMPGFQVNPDQIRRAKEEAEERREQKRVKEIARRLRAEGFVMDKFVEHVKRYTR